MRNVNRVQRAAIVALVAAAVMAGAQQANAGNRRLPVDDEFGIGTLPPVPQGRGGRFLNDSASILMERVRLVLSSARLPNETGFQIRRLPAGRVSRSH